MSYLPGFEPDIVRSATLAGSDRYRYLLTRSWGEWPRVNFIMLNPSTADANQDDPTIRRCIGFARSLGFQRLDVTNLFALRATNPKELKRADDPVGPENDTYLLQTAANASLIICAWGAHGRLHFRDTRIVAMLREAGHHLYVLDWTGRGQPKHPLYLRADIQPSRWEVCK